MAEALAGQPGFTRGSDGRWRVGFYPDAPRPPSWIATVAGDGAGWSRHRVARRHRPPTDCIVSLMASMKIEWKNAFAFSIKMDDDKRKQVGDMELPHLTQQEDSQFAYTCQMISENI